MTNERHVTPINDLIEHEASADCACGPTAEPVPRDDSSIGWLYVHHSLDGREKEPPPDDGIRYVCYRRM